MLRRTGISQRLNLLAGLIALAVFGLIMVTYSSIGAQLSSRQALKTQALMNEATQQVEYDFDATNSYQTSYAFDITRLGQSAAADTATSRKTMLESVAR